MILDRARRSPLPPPPPSTLPPRADAGDTAVPVLDDTAAAEEADAEAPEAIEATPQADTGKATVERILEELAHQDGATFRSPGTLFREFLTSCRQQGVVSAHIDMVEFRRLFAFAVAGVGDLAPPTREALEGLARDVDEDVLAPYLAIAVAAIQGRTKPDEDELARVYGSSSPGRIRRLLDHLERGHLIVVREDFGGARTISVMGLEGIRAD